MKFDDKKIKHPYTVPETYFEILEGNILSEIKINSLKTSLKQEVPNDYFNQLEENILSEIKIESLWKIEKPKVPTNYFDDLENNIIGIQKINELQKIRNLTTPDNYFDDLENYILSTVALEKISKTSIYKAPEPYFDQLEGQILAKTVKPRSKFSISKRPLFFRSAAAVFLIGFASYFYFQNRQPVDKFADIPSSDMVVYLQSQPMEMVDVSKAIDDKTVKNLDSTLFDGVNNKEILQYIQD